jgi:hypothetical protein
MLFTWKLCSGYTSDIQGQKELPRVKRSMLSLRGFVAVDGFLVVWAIDTGIGDLTER